MNEDQSQPLAQVVHEQVDAAMILMALASSLLTNASQTVEPMGYIPPDYKTLIRHLDVAAASATGTYAKWIIDDETYGPIEHVMKAMSYLASMGGHLSDLWARYVVHEMSANDPLQGSGEILTWGRWYELHEKGEV